MRLSQAVFALTGLLLVPAEAFAHPGGLNTEGCHTNRKTGEYHCHRSSGAAPPQHRGMVAQSLYSTASQGGSFRNCTEARAAGAAPIYRGQPGYAPHLDRDGDGIACESYRGR